jgi:hypothetical protein
MSSRHDREELLQFLDRRTFRPILRASPDDYPSEADKKRLEDLQRRTEAERKRYRDDYKTAEEVRTNFLRDLDAEPAGKVHAELNKLRLLALFDIEDEFLELCDKLRVGRRAA